MCIFCSLKSEQTIYETDFFKVIFDIDPIQTGHMLIVSKKHYMNILEIPNKELLDLITLVKKIIDILENQMDIFATTIAQNNGNTMDPKTHFHIHIIPRYRDDGFWDELKVDEVELNLSKLVESIRD